MSASDEFKRVMLAKHEDTELTAFDVYKIGESLLNWISMTATLGHSQPGNSLEYARRPGDVWTGVVHDFVVWASGRTQFAPDCDAKLREFIADSGWQRLALGRLAETLMGPFEKREAA